MLNNHNSHVDGRDLDIPLILNTVQDVTDSRPRTVNLERTWFLIHAMARTCDIEYMFLDRKVQQALYEHALAHDVSKQELSLVLQYPRQPTSREGVVRHWTNHYDYVHIRFRHEGAVLVPAVKAYCATIRADAPGAATDRAR